MRTQRDDLIFMVRLSLHKGLSSIRGLKRILSEEQEKHVAEAIVTELESYNWSISLKERPKPPSV